MKVRITRSFVTPGKTYQEGDVAEMPEDAGWVDAGHAEPLEDDLFSGASEEETEEAGKVDVSEYHTGGGWYDVPGTEGKVRQDEARQILQKQ